MVELERAGALRAPARPHVIQVPRRDADGNAVGGMRLSDIAVLTGTKDGQNQPQTFTCMLVGSLWSLVTKVACGRLSDPAGRNVSEA